MKNPFDFFEKIYCINLDHRTDRWQECCSIFNEYEITHKVERFSAVQYKHQDPRYSKAMGQLGCSASHFEITKNAYERNLENYLVLEDDFYFLDKPDILFDKLNFSISELPSNWQMLYLGGNLDCSYEIYPIQKYSEHLFKLNACHTTHAFSVNKSLYEKILDKSFFKIPIQEWYQKYNVIDVYFSKEILKNNNCYITNPLLCLQKPGFSNIEQNYYDYKEWILQSFENYKANLIHE
jgi:GR25 family glycosyltransferase involved in LPS biosynthesis